MKQLISLIAISIVSFSVFAGNTATSSTAASLTAAWKHQNSASISNTHNLIMVGGQDISNKSLLDGPTAAA